MSEEEMGWDAAPAGDVTAPVDRNQEVVAMVTEAWVENLYDDWREAGDDEREHEMVDAPEMFEDHGPGAVYGLRQPGPLMLDTGNWRAIERAVEGVVMGEPGYADYDEIFGWPKGTVVSACAALGLTPEYFERGPRRGDQ